MALTGCCGCFNLREGSIAVGIIFMVVSCLKMIGVITTYALLGVAESDMRRRNHTGMYLDRVKAIEYGLIPVVFVVAFLILINALLVHGVRRGSKGMILAWLITYGTLFTVSAACSVANLIMMAIDVLLVGQALVLVITYSTLGITALFWYWWVVVLTYFKSLTSRAADLDNSKDVMLS